MVIQKCPSRPYWKCLVFYYAVSEGKSQKCLILVCNVNLVFRYLPSILTLIKGLYTSTQRWETGINLDKARIFPRSTFISTVAQMLWLKNVQSKYLQHFSCSFNLQGFPASYQNELAAPGHLQVKELHMLNREPSAFTCAPLGQSCVTLVLRETHAQLKQFRKTKQNRKSKVEMI